jgi:hypothetical protein
LLGNGRNKHARNSRKAVGRGVFCAIAQAVSRWLPIAVARVRARSGHVGFVVEEMALGQIFSEYFGFPCQSPKAGTVGQLVVEVWTQLDSTPPPHYSNYKKD